MVDTREDRKAWDAIHERQERRDHSLEELQKVIKNASTEKKTPKLFLKLVIHSDGIKADEAAELLNVKRPIIDSWITLLRGRGLVVVDSKKHKNPTVKPSRYVIQRFRDAQKKNKHIEEEKEQLSNLEHRLEEKDEILKETEERLQKEKQMRLDLERKLKDNKNHLEDHMEKALETATCDVWGDDATIEPHSCDTVELKPGGTYLILEDGPGKSKQLFARMVGDGLMGLYITRINPTQVELNAKMERVKICWLSRVKSMPEFESISGLHELSLGISNFIDKHGGSVIVLDGLEYLISNNDFPRVLRLIQQVRDKISTTSATLLIPVNPVALDEQQLSLIKRETIVIV